MSRFYVRPDSVKNDRIYVDGKEAHHILDVMRLNKNDKITAFDGMGKEYFGIIENLSRKSLVIKIDRIEEPKAKKGYSITLAQAIPKMDKMDYIIQKTTELGINSIIPMDTKRAIVKLKKEKILSRRKRWQRIAQEAAKQCGRTDVTAIKEYSDFEDVLEMAKSYDLAIMPSVASIGKASFKEDLSKFRGKSILVFIGPEGGFDPVELDAASKKWITFISLGENVLKCDTAAIAVIAMINYALGSL